MEAPTDVGPSSSTARPPSVDDPLPGLDLVEVGAVSSTPSEVDVPVAASELVARLSTITVGSDLDAGVSALEDVRRLESWVASTKYRILRETDHAAQCSHARWIDGHPQRAFDDDVAPGLSHAARLAVGERSAIAEIACALHVSESAAHLLLDQAELLAEHLTRTAATLRAGSITARAAQLIAQETADYVGALPAVTDEAAEDRLRSAIDITEDALLEAASSGMTPARLGVRARQVKERCHPSTFEERECAARAERFVRITPDRDGMARLTALLPGAVAFTIDGRLSSIARSLREAERSEATVDSSFGASSADYADAGRAPGGRQAPRTVTQMRADVLADLLRGLIPDNPGQTTTVDAAGPGRDRHRRGDGSHRDATDDPVPQVLLTMSAETFLGGEDPAHLGAFGPIAAADARVLATAATSFLLGITAGHGATPDGPSGGGRMMPVLVTNGAQYRIPAALRRALAVRDGTCRFPGCGRSAARCDIDHVTAWADGGSSEPGNLAHLCRKHHVLKHHSGWSVDPGSSAGVPPRTAPDTAARLVWTSPSGRRYPTEPDDPPPF
ncbi:HNH endonuclease signature motif containing protein [Tersicoccus sp. Bi-70]|uniref:HNH endonuclease signature motif containing protein n=1 Tax=Tersicoccus sp. Bi-70 TaxID=1897634 RepID=UPI0009767342|nr:HNH endonuclease signature motif containing protein [Tersicoccus sp. Bi-70]OMH36879.1 hypothetical protein BGP79_14150 [Tersicoccus sp. Bi-70]